MEGASTTTSSRNLSTLEEFVAYITSRKCVKCSKQFIGSEEAAAAIFQSWLSGKVGPSSWMKCTSCSKSSCIACSSISPSSQGKADVHGTKMSWCCSRGRLFMIWIFLCGFDQQYCIRKQRDNSVKGTGTTRKGSGTGYGGSWGSPMAAVGRPSPFGFSAKSYNQEPSNTSKIKAQNAEQSTDGLNKIFLAFLGILLPSPDQDAKFDLDPPPAVTAILLKSKVLNYCAELLRNDSLEDATKRKDLYQALLSFLRTIGAHEATARDAMFQERPVWPESINILALSFSKHPVPPMKDTATSLADLLRNLNIQSNMMLKGATNNPEEFKSNESQDLLWLCRQISDLSAYLLANTQRGTGSKNAIEQSNDRGIIEVSDTEILASHKYTSKAQSMRQSAPGRIKRLITDITVMKTGLPPGIFVKHASSRVDMMKILIVGPGGTPYENGLFEFDLFCGPDYPQKPPLCNFKGTHHGQLYINPNLHPDGKVCLSLLGTWPGEPWQPGQSTILQVLISIQAMIFCEDPISNLPGEMSQSGPSRRNMNVALRRLTVNYAIIQWLQQPSSLWNDVVKLHFQRNADAIQQTVQKWAKEDTGVGRLGLKVAMSPKLYENCKYSRMIPELEKELQKYGTQRSIQNTEPLSYQQSNRGIQGFDRTGKMFRY